MKLLILIMLATIASSAHAEVFKCLLPEGKTVYQPKPCAETTSRQTLIKIEKPDPAKIAEAQARLKAWEAEVALKEAAEAQARIEQQKALDRQAAIEAINRNAKAQQELTNEAKRYRSQFR